MQDRKDLYEVLGLASNATPDQIKSAYRKAALKYHPDKNSGPNAEVAARNFQEANSAYAVLSDPQRRKKYDSQGFVGLETTDLDIQVDVTSLNLLSTVAASLFSNMGVMVKTSLPAKIQDIAKDGHFSSSPLRMGHALEGKADKAQAVFYGLQVSQQDINEGFVVSAFSPTGSRIKLLLFESSGASSWELQEQEDSAPTHRGMSLAGLFFSETKTYIIGPKKGGPEAKLNAENQLFQRLDTMLPREHIKVQPGKLVFAVYNDNWFKRAHFKIIACRIQQEVHQDGSLSDVQQSESKLIQIQSSVRLFEREFTKAQEEWQRATQKFDSFKVQMDETIRQRDDAYLRLVGALGSEPKVARPRNSLLPAWRGST